VKGIPARTPPWAGHLQGEWEARASNSALPLWLRVVSLAYGMHALNGHASYGPGDLGLALSTLDPETGEIQGPSRQTVHHAVKRAVEHGWLDPSSTGRCLVVPGNLLHSGPPQRARACIVHGVGA